MGAPCSLMGLYGQAVHNNIWWWIAPWAIRPDGTYMNALCYSIGPDAVEIFLFSIRPHAGTYYWLCSQGVAKHVGDGLMIWCVCRGRIWLYVVDWWWFKFANYLCIQVIKPSMSMGLWTRYMKSRCYGYVMWFVMIICLLMLINLTFELVVAWLI